MSVAFGSPGCGTTGLEARLDCRFEGVLLAGTDTECEGQYPGERKTVLTHQPPGRMAQRVQNHGRLLRWEKRDSRRPAFTTEGRVE